MDLFKDDTRGEEKIIKKTKLLIPSIQKSISISYENMAFVCIGFVMACIIFFSVGVEKGRRDAGQLSQRTPRLRSGQAEYPSTGKKIEKQESQAKPSVKDKCIIQLASFKQIEAAEKEKDRLVKEGYNNAGVQKSGDYYRVYLGGFSNKLDAEKVLQKLSQKYHGCFIVEYK